MKTMTALLAGLVLSSACSGQDNAATVEAAQLLESGSAKVEATFEYRTVKARVACHLGSTADDGTVPRVFYHPEDYAGVARVLESGLTSVQLPPGEVCDHPERGGTLTYVITPAYTPNATVHEKILASGGYREMTLVFFNRGILDKALEQARNTALNGLFR